MLDTLDRPSVGGGVRHVADCLREYLGSDYADPGKLSECADRLGNRAEYK